MVIHRPRIWYIHDGQENGLAQKILWGLLLWKSIMVFGPTTTPSRWILDFRKKSQTKNGNSVNFSHKYILEFWILWEFTSPVCLLFRISENFLKKMCERYWMSCRFVGNCNFNCIKCQQTFPKKKRFSNKGLSFSKQR